MSAPSPLEDAGLEKDATGSLRLINDQSERYSRLENEADRVGAEDRRLETERDRGRVGYSSYLRRLAGVTQVITPSLEAPRLHTRESHSQKVSLVAREIAEHLARKAEANLNGTEARAIASYGGLDIVAAETAGLAHDFGHPPFGHGGEVALNRLLRKNEVVDGFEGNAQSFRIVTRLERLKDDSLKGLDLTRLTLAAILKYPKMCADEDLTSGDNAVARMSKPPKFGAYQDDSAAFETVSALFPRGEDGSYRQTLEAAIMDLADDISYATHDLEDFYKEKMIDFAAVRVEMEEAFGSARQWTHKSNTWRLDETNTFLVIAKKLEEDFDGYFDRQAYVAALTEVHRLIFTQYRLGIEYEGSIAASTSVSGLVGGLLRTVFEGLEVSIVPKWKNGPGVYLSADVWHRIQVLKTITRRYVVGTSRMGMVERAQSSAVDVLYNSIVSWLSSGPDAGTLPQPLVSYLEDAGSWKESLNAGHHRAIADYICSLSDSQCLARSRWLSGGEVPAIVLAG